MRMICKECGNVLTDEERTYYHHQCETCTHAEFMRWEAWRKGGDDPELDAMFAAIPTKQPLH